MLIIQRINIKIALRLAAQHKHTLAKGEFHLTQSHVKHLRNQFSKNDTRLIHMAMICASIQYKDHARRFIRSNALEVWRYRLHIS